MPIQGVDGHLYPGARIESEYDDRCRPNMSFFHSPRHDQPIVTLRTKFADVVHLTKLGSRQLDAFDLMAYARDILIGAERIHNYGGVRFPMVDLDVRPDVGYLLGLWTRTRDEQRSELVQAVQQCKLQMNHLGAVATDAFAAAATLECVMVPKPDMEIDDDFLFVLERPGLQQPVFVAVVRPDSWKDPGELNLG